MNSAEGTKDRIQAKHIRKFVSLCKQMNRLIDEMRAYEPRANLYLEEDTMNLMVGDSHAGIGQQPQRQNVIESVLMPHSSGGGW